MSVSSASIHAFSRLLCWALFLGSCHVARTVFAHGDLDERIASLTAKLAVNPSNAVLLLQRADLQRDHGELAPALADAERASQLRPDWAAAHLQQARILFDQQHFSNSLAAAESALRLEPDSADARVIRSRCLIQCSRTNEAVADLSRVLSREEPALPDLYLERARLQVGAGDIAGAVKGLEEGIHKLGNTPSLALPAIEFERRLGRYRAALERLDSMARYLPRDSALALRAEILKEAGSLGPTRDGLQQEWTPISNHVERREGGTAEAGAPTARTQTEPPIERQTDPTSDPTR